MTDPEGKVVLTTGTNSGIGLATTVKLATVGFRSIGAVRSETKAAAVMAAAKEAFAMSGKTRRYPIAQRVARIR